MANIRDDIHITTEEVERFKAGLVSVYRLSHLKQCDKNSIKGRLKKVNDPEVQRLLTMSAAQIKDEFELRKVSKETGQLKNRLTEDDIEQYRKRLSTMEDLASRHSVGTRIIKRWLGEKGVTKEERNKRRDAIIPDKQKIQAKKHQAFVLMDKALMERRA